MANCLSKANKVPDTSPFNIYANVQFLGRLLAITKWEDLIRNDINLKWPKWNSFDTKLIFFVCTIRKKKTSKIKLNEWGAYLN